MEILAHNQAEPLVQLQCVQLLGNLTSNIVIFPGFKEQPQCVGYSGRNVKYVVKLVVLV